MDLDVTAVDDLARANFSREADGQLRVRQVAQVVLDERRGWATLLTTVQDRVAGGYGPARYVLSRWRRLAGAWRLQGTFRLAPQDLAALRIVAGAM